MPKIAFVIGTMRGGGAQRVVSILSDYLQSRNNKVVIITTSDDILDYSLTKGINFISLTSKINTPIFKQLDCFLRLRKHLIQASYDYVIAFLPMTCIYVSACHKNGCSFHYVLSERMDPHQDPQSPFLRKLRDIAYEEADGVIFQTVDAQRYFPKSIQEKSCIIYNPINPSLPKADFDHREKTVVTAVRLEKQKNLEMLIDAFSIFSKRFPEYQLHIYGQGSQRDKLQMRINEANLSDKCLLMGFVPDVYSKMQHAEFFVLSSNYEGVSNSMLEAMCLGLPVISTDHPVGGARMFISDGFNGYLTPVGDRNAFAQAMIKMASDNEKRIQMGHHALLVRENLEPLTVCKQWEQFVFTGVLNEKTISSDSR